MDLQVIVKVYYLGTKIGFIFAWSQDTKYHFSHCGIRCAFGIEVRAKCQILLQNAHFYLLAIVYSSISMNTRGFAWLI